MKEFAVGAVVIAALAGVFSVMMVVMAPIADWAEPLNNNGEPPIHFENYHAYQLPAKIATVMTILLVVGFASKGIGAGVLLHMKKGSKNTRRTADAHLSEKRVVQLNQGVLREAA